MATPIDYGTHAEAPPSIDYGAHAAAPGDPPLGDQPATLSGVAGTMANHAERAGGALWDSIKGAASLLTTDPRETVKKAFDYTTDAVGRVRAAASHGEAKEAILSTLGAVPMAGPAFEQIAREIDDGKYPEAIGHAAGLRAIAEAPGMAGKIPGIVSDATPIASAALKAGGKDVGLGAAKAAGAYAITQVPIIGGLAKDIAGYELGKSGAKQIGQGIRAGWNAAREAATPEPAAAAPSTRPAPAWAAAPDPQAAAVPDATPIPGQLPSGRVPGGIANATPLPQAAAPAPPTNPYVPAGPGMNNAPLVSPSMRAAAGSGTLARPVPIPPPVTSPVAPAPVIPEPVVAQAAPAQSPPSPAPAAAPAAPPNPAAAAYAKHLADVTEARGAEGAAATANKDARFADYLSNPPDGVVFRGKTSLTGDDVSKMSLQDYRELHAEVPTGKIAKTGKPTKFTADSDNAKLEVRKEALANLMRSREAAAAAAAARPAAYANAAEELAAARARMGAPADAAAK